MEPLNIDWESTLERFLRTLTGSKRTIEAYSFGLEKFRKWAAKMGKQQPREITGAEIEEFLVGLRRRDGIRYKVSSRNQVLAAVKGYYGFLVKDRLISPHDNPAALVSAKKRPKRSPVFLEIDEVHRIKDVICRRVAETPFSQMMKARDLAFLSLFLGTGLRISELEALNLETWEEAMMNGWLTIVGKGDKERVVPPFDEAVEDVRAYLKVRPELPPDADGHPLFISRKKGRLDRVQIERLVKAWAKDAGITKLITPHKLRATWVTHLLDMGANPRDVQEMAGHEDLNTLLFYAGRKQNEQLRQVVKKHQLRYT